MRYFSFLSIFALGAVTLTAGTVGYNVSLNTTALETSPAGPFTIDFQLSDGSGTNDGNNTAAINLLSLGGGSLVDPAANIGGSSGSLEAGVTITDDSFLNEFDQGFTPGSILNFDVFLTTNVDAGPTPDQFTFAILDGTGAELPTVQPNGGDSFVTINIDSATPQVLTYASDTSTPPAGGGSPLNIAAPLVTPEPSGILTMLGGLALLGLRRKRLA